MPLYYLSAPPPGPLPTLNPKYILDTRCCMLCATCLGKVSNKAEAFEETEAPSVWRLSDGQSCQERPAALVQLPCLPFLSQTYSLTLNQMHVVVFSESIFHVENQLYPSDISLSAFLCVVLCLLAPCWSPGHQNIKVQ